MKLNKYIYEMLMSDKCGRFIEERGPKGIHQKETEDEIEQWIHDWYKEVYDRKPPMWLAGARWYDRRAKKIKEAKEAEIKAAAIKEAEARSYDLDEV